VVFIAALGVVWCYKVYKTCAVFINFSLEMHIRWVQLAEEIRDGTQNNENS